MPNTRARRPRADVLSSVLIGIQCALLSGGLLYRATLYWKIPVGKGDPYGLGDILELLLYCALLGSSALTVLTAVAFLITSAVQSRWRLGALLAAGLLALPGYLLLHPHVPRLW